MGRDTKIRLSVKDEYMQNKNYDIGAISLFSINSALNEDNRYFIQRDEVKTRLKKNGLTRHKIKVVIDTFLDLGLIQEDEENDCYIVESPATKFVKLQISTVNFCLNALSPLAFKVYCYLKSKQDIHNQYNLQENYFFSESELLRVCGYSRNLRNELMIKQVLDVLESTGLIYYNHESVGRAGSHGVYHELYGAFEKSASQVRADNELISEHGFASYQELEDKMRAEGTRLIDLE